MTTNHHRQEAIQRGARMLRTALGTPGVVLHVSCDDENARRFYWRHGFEEIQQEGAHFRMRWPAARRPDATGGIAAVVN